jgi:hypothetical protein
MESRLLGFPCFPHSVISNGLLWKRVSQNHKHREGHADRTASSDSRRTVLVQECFPLPPLAGVSRMDLRLLYDQISRMTIIKTPTSYFACTSPAITAASLSSIWFQPSI